VNLRAHGRGLDGRWDDVRRPAAGAGEGRGGAASERIYNTA